MDRHLSGRIAPDVGSRRSDRECVVAFQEGDPSAFEEIHRRYYHRVERVCRRYLIDDEDARDASQETMLRVFRGLSALSGDYALRAWTVRIATNVCLDVLRRRSRQPDSSAIATMASATHVIEPCEAIVALSRGEEVHATLCRMPEPLRRVLLLRELQGRSHVEIGSALGMTAFQAKALIYRARQRFRQQWHKGGGCLLVVSCSAGSLLRSVRRRAPTGASDGPAMVAAVTVPAGNGYVERIAAALTIVIAGTIGIDEGSGFQNMTSGAPGQSEPTAHPGAVVDTPGPDPMEGRHRSSVPGATAVTAASTPEPPAPTERAGAEVGGMPAIGSAQSAEPLPTRPELLDPTAGPRATEVAGVPPADPLAGTGSTTVPSDAPSLPSVPPDPATAPESAVVIALANPQAASIP